MSSATRRGGIPGPESRTGLTRPSMTEAEFERRITSLPGSVDNQAPQFVVGETADGPSIAELEPSARSAGSSGRGRAPRTKPAKPRRVQRMFAIEEDVDKKLWLYAIHIGKDRSEVVNDLLKPVVASMVLYDSRDRRGSRQVESASERPNDADGDLPS